MPAYRFQIQRTKGFRNPDGGRRVARPSIFGNPFRDGTREERVRMFAEWLRAGEPTDPARGRILANLHQLKDRPLGCFCPPGEPCHADVLLEEANK